MQPSGVYAQLRMTGPAALIAFDTARPGVPPAFRHDESRHGIRAGAQVIDPKLLGGLKPSLAFAGQTEKVHRSGATPHIDAATDAIR